MENWNLTSQDWADYDTPDYQQEMAEWADEWAAANDDSPVDD